VSSVVVGMSTSLTSISWTDIVFTNILPRLTVQDWFRLRCVSRSCYLMMQEFFAQNKVLDLSRVKAIPEPAFRILTENTTLLKHIDLTGLKIANNELVQMVLKMNPLLVYLNLTDCHHCTAGVLQTLSIKNRQIQRLILKDCHWVSRESIEYHTFHQGTFGATGQTVQLLEIDFTGCWELIDNILIDFLHRFNNLQVVRVGKIYSLTDLTMRALASYTRKLRHLDIRGCWRISDSGLRLVAEYCRELESVCVEDCRGITENLLTKLRASNILIDRKIDNTLQRIQQMQLEYMNDRI